MSIYLGIYLFGAAALYFTLLRGDHSSDPLYIRLLSGAIVAAIWPFAVAVALLQALDKARR